MEAVPRPVTTAGAPGSFLWRLILYLHLVAAVFGWWLLPGGFPLAHPRFWTNEVFPFGVAAVCAVCLWGERRGNVVLRSTAATTIPAFWVAAVLAAAVIFPQSARRFFPPAIGCVIVLVGVFWFAFRRQKFSHWQTAFGVLASIFAGVAVVSAQRGGEAETHPVNSPLPQFESNVELRLSAILTHLSEAVDVQPAEGRVIVHQQVPDGSAPNFTEVASQPQSPSEVPRRYRIEVEPLLTFDSGSPDRFWTILAPARFRTSPQRELVGLRREDGSLTARYRDDTDAILHVDASEGADSASMEVMTRLDHPIYSHLNSFSAFTIHGCRQPAVAFSPCPDVLVGVKPFDYPFGRPLRLAYVGPNDVFHVAEAKSGEKGPFSEFGSGRLPPEGPLMITIFDDKRAVMRITLDDWASQAARGLSPTAGWGLPVNAIEFSRVGGANSETITIWVTLAGTSVGRGWDSVGHTQGTYRNRLRIEILGRQPSEK
jgi:hypothetical protein